jgi:hypothetical protein
MGEKLKDESAAAEKDENLQNHLLSQTPFDTGMRWKSAPVSSAGEQTEDHKEQVQKIEIKIERR